MAAVESGVYDAQVLPFTQQKLGNGQPAEMWEGSEMWQRHL